MCWLFYWTSIDLHKIARACANSYLRKQWILLHRAYLSIFYYYCRASSVDVSDGYGFVGTHDGVLYKWELSTGKKLSNLLRVQCKCLFAFLKFDKVLSICNWVRIWKISPVNPSYFANALTLSFAIPLWLLAGSIMCAAVDSKSSVVAVADDKCRLLILRQKITWSCWKFKRFSDHRCRLVPSMHFFTNLYRSAQMLHFNSIWAWHAHQQVGSSSSSYTHSTVLST